LTYSRRRAARKRATKALAAAQAET
jgi:hypothetical protein